MDIIGLQRYSFYSEYQTVHRFFMPNLEKFPTSASLAIRTSTPNQHAQRENRRRTVVERCYVEENRRRAVSYVSTGLARLPRDIDSARNYRRRAVVERCCAEGNRRSAVLYVSTGLARLPRDTYRRRAVVEMPSPHRHRRGATALFRNPVRGAHPSHLACRRYATTCGGTADSTC